MTGTKHGIRPELEPLAVPIDDLHIFPGHPSRPDLQVVTEMLMVLGQYRPVVANRRDGAVLVRPELLVAAKELGWTHVAVGWVDVDEDQARRIVLVDHRSAELSGYDPGDLRAILEAADDLAGTGWTVGALAMLTRNADEDEAEPPELPLLPSSGAAALREALLVYDAADRERFVAATARLRAAWEPATMTELVLRALGES